MSDDHDVCVRLLLFVELVVPDVFLIPMTGVNNDKRRLQLDRGDDPRLFENIEKRSDPGKSGGLDEESLGMMTKHLSEFQLEGHQRRAANATSDQLLNVELLVRSRQKISVDAHLTYLVDENRRARRVRRSMMDARRGLLIKKATDNGAFGPLTHGKGA